MPKVLWRVCYTAQCAQGLQQEGGSARPALVQRLTERAGGKLEDLLDRQAVVETITTLFVATDRRDWERVARCFAPTVFFDMSSAGGGPAAPLAPTQITSAWAVGLEPISAVHHQAGNYEVRISGDEAEASCYGVAWHYRPTRSGRDTRTFVGSYDFHLLRGDGWRIDRFRFTLKFIDGNARLEHEE